MLNLINKPIVEAYAQIDNDYNANIACSSKYMELDFMVAGGKRRVYTSQLATKLSGTIIAMVSADCTAEEQIRTFPVGMKTTKGMRQSLNASLYMVAAYSVLINGYTSHNHIQTALENWADEDNIQATKPLDFASLTTAIIAQFQLDGVIAKETEQGQGEDGQQFQGFAATAEIQKLRIETMHKLWDNAKPLMKPMLYPLTWYKRGKRVVCDLKNLYFTEEVTQDFIDSFNRMGHTGYTVNGAIRAEIKKKLKRGQYKQQQDNQPIEATMLKALSLAVGKTYYFPHTPDYRGRGYARGGLTTFQGIKDLRAHCLILLPTKKLMNTGYFYT